MSKKFDITLSKNKFTVNLTADDWDLYDVDDMEDACTEGDRINSATVLNSVLQMALNDNYLSAVETEMDKAMSGESAWGATDTACREILFAIGCELFDNDIAEEFFNL